jgi:hypothetical protein
VAGWAWWVHRLEEGCVGRRVVLLAIAEMCMIFVTLENFTPVYRDYADNTLLFDEIMD